MSLKPFAEHPRAAIRNPNESQVGGHGLTASGRIVRLSTGQCSGFIRMADNREIWFHRSDMHEPAMFNEFVVGDLVAFDLLEDRISGARALKVRRSDSRGRA